MSYNTYKIIKSLRPIDLFDIITMGHCDRNEFIKCVKNFRGEWYLNNWNNNKTEIDVLDFYISDTGFSYYTTREEAESLEKKFKSFGLYYEVWSRWYGGKTWIFGFNYSGESFENLHLKWERDKKLESLF